MKIIADAGGTKTDWRLISESGEVKQFQSEGISIAQLRTYGASIPKGLPKKAAAIYFYGAGLVAKETQDVLGKILANRFNCTKIEVKPDTLAAARATCGDRPEWVGILGTGSALVHYDGHKINHRVPSLGFILGDEGSGTELGMRFFKAYLRGQLSEQLRMTFIQQYEKLGGEDVLNQISLEDSKGLFNSIVPFLSERQNDPLIYSIIYQSFLHYFDAYLIKIEQPKTMAFSGSVAHFFSNILRKVAQEKGIDITMITQFPIAGLTLYHQNHD